MNDIVILGGARTAIGTFGGSLAGTSPIELGTISAKAALERSGVEGGQPIGRQTTDAFRIEVRDAHGEGGEIDRAERFAVVER